MFRSYAFPGQDKTRALVFAETDKPNLFRVELWVDGNFTTVHLTKQDLETIAGLHSSYGSDRIHFKSPIEIAVDSASTESAIFGGGS